MPDPILELRDISVAVGGTPSVARGGTPPVARGDTPSVARGGTPYVQGVSLQLAKGEAFGLLGPNGAGKTTLLRTLYAAARPSHGEILLEGRAKARWGRADWARKLGALVQGAGLLTGLTPEDIVDIGLKPLSLDPAERQSRLDEALAFAGLTEKRGQSAESLSGGELQRCYFAQLLARDPDIYVLDEPTNHLDLHFQLKLLDEVRRRGRTALATFHDLAIAARFCDRVAILERGRIVSEGSPEAALTRARLAESYRVAGELRGGALHLEGPV